MVLVITERQQELHCKAEVLVLTEVRLVEGALLGHCVRTATISTAPLSAVRATFTRMEVDFQNPHLGITKWADFRWLWGLA